MILFSKAANGRLMTTQMQPSVNSFYAYSVMAFDGSLSTVLINMDPLQTVQTEITWPDSPSSATELILTGPSLASTSGMTLGESSIGLDGTSNEQTHSVSITSGASAVSVPPMSAVLVRTQN